jgi:hypothetical protein
MNPEVETCLAPTPGLPGRGAGTPGGEKLSSESFRPSSIETPKSRAHRWFAAGTGFKLTGGGSATSGAVEEGVKAPGGGKTHGRIGLPSPLAAVEQRTSTEVKARKVSEDRRPPRGGGPFEPTPGGQGWPRGRARAVEGETFGEFNPRSVTA